MANENVITKKFLIINTIKGKDGTKWYASGKMWSDDKRRWTDQKQKEGFGDYLIEITGAEYGKLTEQLTEPKAFVVDAYVKSYNDYGFPIWALKI